MIVYFLLGGAFGAVFMEAEVISWFRIQEMFRFDAFHMFNLRADGGDPLGLAPKTLGNGVRYLIGGTTFGLGWALTGACPGPLVALIGSGVPVMIVALVSALAGTWTYGLLRPRLPH